MDRRNFLKCGTAGIGCTLLPTDAGAWTLSPSNIPDSFSREAMFYDKLASGYACGLCPNKCTVTEVRPGNCRTRYVKGDKFICNAYGNPYYQNTLFPAQLPLFHYRPAEKLLLIGTCGCNLGCLNCNVSEVSQKSPGDLWHHTLFPAQVIEACRKQDIRTIAYGYSEPVVFYEYMLETARLAHSAGINNLLCSNGHINERPLRELAGWIDGAIIDVKAFSEASYQKLTGGSIMPVFNSLKVLKEMNVWLEISHLLVPGWTDNFELMGKMFAWMKENGFASTPLHIDRFEPAYRLKQLSETPADLMHKAYNMARDAGIRYVYLNLPGEPDTFDTHCPKCHKVLVERTLKESSKSNIVNQSCPSCGEKVPGIW